MEMLNTKCNSSDTDFYRVKRGYLEYKNKKQAALVTRSVIGVLQVEKCHVIINNGPSTRVLSIRTTREHGPFQDVFTGGQKMPLYIVNTNVRRPCSRRL